MTEFNFVDGQQYNANHFGFFESSTGNWVPKSSEVIKANTSYGTNGFYLPFDGTDYIGGNFGSALNISSTLPGLLTEAQDLDFSLFLDAANIWGVDYDSALDKNGIRSSVGIGIDWLTPVGPLTFSFAQPITKEPTDIEETFRFNIGTSF